MATRLPADASGRGRAARNVRRSKGRIGTMATRRFCGRCRMASAFSWMPIRAATWSASIPTTAARCFGRRIFPPAGPADHKNVYYPLNGGAVAAVRLSDGKIAWRVPIKPSDAHLDARGHGRVGLEGAVTVIPGVVFAGGWDGVLHALSTTDGHELWQYDTAREYTTVNGGKAHGGSLGA